MKNNIASRISELVVSKTSGITPPQQFVQEIVAAGVASNSDEITQRAAFKLCALACKDSITFIHADALDVMRGLMEKSRSTDDADRLAFEICSIIASDDGITLDHASVADAMRRLLKNARSGDKAERVAFEICSTVCRENGVILDHVSVATMVRNLLKQAVEDSERRSDRIAELRAAYRAALGSPEVRGDSLKEISAHILAPLKNTRTMSTRPIKPEDVCATCSRGDRTNINFLRYAADSVPARTKKQLAETEAAIKSRLSALGMSGDVDVSVVVHRGCCRIHGSDDRVSGDGVAEIPGVLIHVDFGDGVAIEGEHEVLA